MSTDNKMFLSKVKDNKLEKIEELNDSSIDNDLLINQDRIVNEKLLLISETDFNKFNNNELSVSDLNKTVKDNYAKYFLSFSSLEVSESDFKSQEKIEDPVEDKIENSAPLPSFIDSPDNFKKVETPKSENNFTPNDFMKSFNKSVNSKLQEINVHRSFLKKNKKFNKKTLYACGGAIALGMVIFPLSPIVTPIALAVGAYSMIKTKLKDTPEMKSLDLQASLLQKATKNIDGKNNFDEILFDPKIETEFLKLCEKENVVINPKIFPTSSFKQGINKKNKP